LKARRLNYQAQFLKNGTVMSAKRALSKYNMLINDNHDSKAFWGIIVPMIVVIAMTALVVYRK